MICIFIDLSPGILYYTIYETSDEDSAPREEGRHKIDPPEPQENWDGCLQAHKPCKFNEIMKHIFCQFSTRLHGFILSLCCIPQDKPVKISFGFQSNINQDYGILMYHRNRLIKAFEKIGCQKQVRIVGLVYHGLKILVTDMCFMCVNKRVYLVI